MNAVLGCVVLMLTTVSTARGTTSILIDDFNDGNDDGWTRADTLPGPPEGPATWELVELGPTSYEYNFRNGQQPITSWGTWMTSEWDDSFDPRYTDGFLRAKVRADTRGSLAWLWMRNTPGTDETYVFAANTWQRSFQIEVVDGEWPWPAYPVQGPGLTFDVGEEWYIEAGTVGDQISMKVWQVGDPEPAAPQLVITDPTYSSGVFGLGGNVHGGDALPDHIDVTFDDIWFTPVPEPSTGLLLLLGATGVLGATCRHGN